VSQPPTLNTQSPILVTGCVGFIGWKVSELLLGEGHTVIGIDNLNEAYDARLKRWRLQQLEGQPNFNFHRLDITDRPALRNLFNSKFESRKSKFDAVMNLAARAGVRQSLEDPWAYYETNVTGTLNLLELCREFSVPKFVLASTSSVYGEAARPFREEVSTDRPLSPYAASKKAAEALCYTYHHLYGLDMTIFRYFTVYGPAGRPDMSIFRFIKWMAEGESVIVYGDGTQERDFTYVDDIARGTVLGLKPVGYAVINLGSDHPVPLKRVIALLEDLLGQPARIDRRPAHRTDVPATWADVSQAKRLLGWEPFMTFEEGLEKTVAWYREQRQWAKAIAVGPD
jgi:UDP-glucuronate 4-epimerase